MYDELIKMLRTCADRDSCIGWDGGCPYFGTGWCGNKAEKAADAIEELLARRETVMDYDARELILFAAACRESDVSERDLKDFARNTEMAFQFVQAEFEKSIQEALSRMIPEPPKEES